MTVLCVSTSSSLASVALFQNHRLVGSASRESHLAASKVVIALVDEVLEQSGLTLEAVDGFVADCGPGSFTGIKVGVSLVKAWGFAFGKQVAGIPAFDLVGGVRIAIPIRKNYFAIRSEGEVRFGSAEQCGDCEGYGFKTEGIKMPQASNLKWNLGHLMWVDPMQLKPDYLVEPSVSVAKNPLIMGHSAGP